jgi:DNA-directed RNA polymerase specialized sigma24 family protein
LNKLILEILPQIEIATKKVTRDIDQQNELRQFTILKCYEYQELVKRLFVENNIKKWIYIVVKNEYIRMTKHQPREAFRCEVVDDEYLEFDLDRFKPHLTFAEQMWIRAYKECGGKYSEIEKRKGITEKVVRLRILAIIEKCKRLKHILY